MKHIAYACGFGLWCAACGAPGESSDQSGLLVESNGAQPAPTAEHASANPNAQVVQRFSAEGTNYEIISLGPEALLLTATGHMDTVGPHQRLEQGSFTLLETYLALAPDGAEPSPRLLDYHDFEAELLDRPDSSVLLPKLTREALIDKAESNLDKCKRSALDYLPAETSGATVDVIDGATFGSSVAWNSPMTELAVVAAVCNLGNSVTISRSGQYTYSGDPVWQVLSTGEVPVGWYYAIKWGQTQVFKQVRVTGSNQGSAIPAASAWHAWK